MMTWIITLVSLIIIGLVTLWRVRQRAIESEDPKIDELVERNKFKYIKGMSEPDWDRVHEIGQERWDDAVRAKERLS